MEEVAAELPLVAICELMGIPIEDRKQFFEWTNIMLGADDPELTTSPEDGQMAMMGLFEYGRKLAIRYRENPEPCIVGSLLDGEVEGEKLTEDEFCYFFLLLIVAGNETTRTVTSHGMRLLMEHPEQYRMLVDNPALIPDAIEEFLRYNPAVIQFRRTAMEDVEVGGQLIRKGDKVMLNYQAASHDERLFTDPDRFDITRQQREDVRNQHRAFGFGQHFCLGSHLARLELKVIFEEIIGRIRNPELVGEIRWLRSMLINGIKEMNIKFDKAA
ncbi:MAG: cytochrome P450 [Spongiibacteraceae bacterium]|nr:cytochrome P450 [Spongiibacteraceae bacterium]